MEIKTGVKLAGLRPEMVLALIICEQVFRQFTPVEMVVTEATGGKHGVASLHYVGLAVDLRTRDIPVNQVEKIAFSLRAALGENYDVVVEADHIHVEFQPK